MNLPEMLYNFVVCTLNIRRREMPNVILDKKEIGVVAALYFVLSFALYLATAVGSLLETQWYIAAGILSFVFWIIGGVCLFIEV